MSTTIASSFLQFKSNLEITSLQQSTVSTRQQNVRNAMGRGFTVLDSFLTGSYSRSTMIAPLSKADIDIFIILDSSYYSNFGQASLLDSTRSVLLKTWPKTPKISRNGQAVTITFTDFQVDVVPAFNRLGGGYLIPNAPGRQWIETNPKTHVTFMTNANAEHLSMLVPLVKMIKAWNREIGGAFSSFYLELLVEKALRGVRISDYSSGCRFVFDKGRDLIRYKIVDPSGLGSQVNGLSGARTVQEAVRKFQTAYDIAINAEYYAAQGNNREAVNQWRRIFGTYFPAYG
jgi:hypothetical protein